MSRVDLVAASPASEAAASSGVLRSAIELTKPGIVRMVVIVTAVGYVLGAFGRAWSPTAFFVGAALCLLGTALAAAGANALNQVVEAGRDARMRRTAGRPVPSGRLGTGAAWAIGLGACVAGDALLWFAAHPAAAVVAVVVQVTYLGWYTPLKPVTPLSTVVGALPGALPPLIGWAAAAGHQRESVWGGLDQPGGWTLVAIMFVWQVPHVLAIAWKYRDQYAAGGYRVLPSVDPTGVRTGTTALLWSIALLPVSLTPIGALPGVVSGGFAVVALPAGACMIAASALLLRQRTDAAAMRLFIVSILYLPVVLLAIVVDALLAPLLFA